MVPGDDLAARNRKVVAEAFDQSSDDGEYLLNRYRQFIAREQWCTMFQAPGDPATPAGGGRERNPGRIMPQGGPSPDDNHDKV